MTTTTSRLPFLTVHTLTALPWHNLNRDENGSPKQLTEGGVTRARLSSQSLKRAARIGFERSTECAEASVRTKTVPALVVKRVEELTGPMEPKEREALRTKVMNRVGTLTHTTTDGKKETLVWLSAGELETLAQTYAKDRGADKVAPVENTSTGSLAIAGFGRMFAAAPDLSLRAAVAVSDAITTHAAEIELDWFAAVDDGINARAGAGQLGFTMQTTGVYYRSFTIDRAQLARNYDLPLDSAAAEPQLRSFIRHLTLALPGGREAGTAAHTLPALIVAEEQAQRVAYDFHEPVTRAEDGGFLRPSIQALLNKAADARAFDPDLFGETFYTGTEAAHHLGAVPVGTFAGYTDFVLDFLRAA